jgi:hypothetical protein
MSLDDLTNAIAGLYCCFGRYQVIHPIHGSPLSVTKLMQAELAAQPLRSLSGKILQQYLFKAISTWGTAEEFKHFLPRILELFALDQHTIVWPELVQQKLWQAGFSEWPMVEKCAVEAFYLALWKSILTTFPAPSLAASQFLRMVMNAQPCLDEWQNRLNETPAKLHLIELILTNYHMTAINQQWAFGAGLPITQWLLLPDKLQLLEALFFDPTMAEFAEDASLAIEHIEMLGYVLGC